MKSKTVAIAFQLRVPNHLTAADMKQLVREAIERKSGEWSADHPELSDMTRTDPIRLYRDRVEVFTP